LCTTYSQTTVQQHIKDYFHSKKLKSENGNSKRRLSIEQTQLLVEHLTQVTYCHTHQICSYIRRLKDKKLKPKLCEIQKRKFDVYHAPDY
jgi:hypothetical protein